MASPIEAVGLSRRFGRRVAVQDLSLVVASGETLGLVGPDGAGKTTVLRMLAAVLRPSSGTARVFGHDTHREAAAVHAMVGYMPQRFGLYGDLTVWENLDFSASIFGVAAVQRRQRFDDLLHFTGLGGFQDRRAAHLSGGMQKKLALASTLIHEPRLLLLDEPTTGVDPVSRRDFWDILGGLRVKGITIVVSTPYMDEAERCTRVGFMFGGRLVLCDTPEHVRALVPGSLVVLRPVETAHSEDCPEVGRAMRLARAAATDMPGVLETQTHGEMLHLIVDDAQRRMGEIRATLTARGIEIEEMREARPRLEDAFISLVRRHSAAGLGGRVK